MRALLSNPGVMPALPVALDAMRYCVDQGAIQAQKVVGHDVVILVIGNTGISFIPFVIVDRGMMKPTYLISSNTGAGKSTCINYLIGCDMKLANATVNGEAKKVHVYGTN